MLCVLPVASLAGRPSSQESRGASATGRRRRSASRTLPRPSSAIGAAIGRLLPTDRRWWPPQPLEPESSSSVVAATASMLDPPSVAPPDGRTATTDAAYAAPRRPGRRRARIPKLAAPLTSSPTPAHVAHQVGPVTPPGSASGRAGVGTAPAAVTVKTVSPSVPRAASPPPMPTERPLQPRNGARPAAIRVVDIPRPEASSQLPFDATVEPVVAALYRPFLILHGPIPAVRVVVTVRPAVVPPLVEPAVRRVRGLAGPVLRRAGAESSVPCLTPPVPSFTYRVQPSAGAFRARRAVNGRTAAAGPGVAGSVTAPVAVEPRMANSVAPMLRLLYELQHYPQLARLALPMPRRLKKVRVEALVAPDAPFAPLFRQ